MSESPRVTLRSAEPADAARLLAWRNDPETRRASFNTAEVTQAEHQRWLAARLSDPDSRLWIALAGGEVVGQVRVDRQPDRRAEISIGVAPERRRRGYAVAMLAAAARKSAQEGLAVELTARIKPGNAASLSAFARAGYRTVSEGPEEIVLVSTPCPS